jgi:hypothetical protein
MLSKDKEKTLIEIFIAIDDFCIQLHKWKQSQPERFPVGNWDKPVMSKSELMSICVFYHYSGYKCFQYYYQQMVQAELKTYFPHQISYERFLASLLKILPGLYVFLKYCSLQSEQTNFYFIDSKQLPVCHNRRIASNRVFEGIAQRGKSSTGWFYGLKLHLIINNLGQIVNFLLTPGNVADNNHQVLRMLLTGLQGECYGDKGYLSKLFEEFYHQGLHLITKVKSNMKHQLMGLTQKMRLKKRALIESVNDLLVSVFDIQHTRHRNALHAIVHLFAGLIAYCFYPRKPSVYMAENQKLIIA